MEKDRASMGGYFLAGIVGAVMGGLAIAWITRAIPTMMSRIMSSMMGSMMKGMGGEGCDPEEM